MKEKLAWEAWEPVDYIVYFHHSGHDGKAEKKSAFFWRRGHEGRKCAFLFENEKIIVDLEYGQKWEDRVGEIHPYHQAATDFWLHDNLSPHPLLRIGGDFGPPPWRVEIIWPNEEKKKLPLCNIESLPLCHAEQKLVAKAAAGHSAGPGRKKDYAPRDLKCAAEMRKQRLPIKDIARQMNRPQTEVRRMLDAYRQQQNRRQ